MELYSVDADPFNQAVDQVIVNARAVLVANQVLAAAVVHHEDQVVLVLHDLVFLIVYNVKPVKHPVESLHEDLVTASVEPKFCHLCLKDYQPKLKNVVEAKGARQKKHGVSPPELGPQGPIGEASRWQGHGGGQLPSLRPL